LREALANAPVEDRRAIDGAERGGRRLAASVAQKVLEAA
jgi:malonate decarboxylase gamma subunit